jgi:hypothetical protein
MSNGVKILLIVLGSFAVLLVVTVSLFVLVIVPRAIASFKEDQNPAGQRKLAASIADFDMPPGYKQLIGMNMIFVKMVTIVPVDRKHRHFSIILEGMDIPTASTEDIEQNLNRSMGRTSPAFQCTNPEVSSDEIIKAKTRSITLHVRKCADPGSNVETAIATFPGTSKLVMFVASGNQTEFDMVAVRRLLASVR